MKRLFFSLVFFCILLTSCGIKKEMVALGITQTALSSTQSAFSVEMTQSAKSFSDSMSATLQFNETQAAEIIATQTVLQTTATFQTSIIAAQEVINQQEAERQKILDEAAKARLNPEVEGIDPVIDSLLLSTNVNIGKDGYILKGLRYSVEKIQGINLSERNVYYDDSDASGDFYILMMASHNSALFPSIYQQIVENNENGTYERVVINKQSYFHKEVTRGYGSEVATIIEVNDNCHILTVARLDYQDEFNSWIDYLIDTNGIILSSSLPLCEGT